MITEPDPLDVLFVTGEEARRLENARLLVSLAEYLDKMPAELKPLFRERFRLVPERETEKK